MFIKLRKFRPNAEGSFITTVNVDHIVEFNSSEVGIRAAGAVVFLSNCEAFHCLESGEHIAKLINEAREHSITDDVLAPEFTNLETAVKDRMVTGASSLDPGGNRQSYRLTGKEEIPLGSSDLNIGLEAEWPKNSKDDNIGVPDRDEFPDYDKPRMIKDNPQA